MKKLLNVIVLTLAINFLAIAGGVGWLQQQGRLNREKLFAIKEVLFPKPTDTAPATQPAEAPDPTTQPMLRLDELLSRASGRSASEQVEFIQHTFDAQMAVLDRRQRELNDLNRQIELAKQQLSKDRTQLSTQEQDLKKREDEATRLSTDKGFQDSLTLYNSMPSKQVKTVFMSLDDQTVMNYLQAMQPRTAAKIIKEFKSPEETARVETILEKMRQAKIAIDPGAASPSGAMPGATAAGTP